MNLIKEQNLLNGDIYYEFEVSVDYYFDDKKVKIILDKINNKIIDAESRTKNVLFELSEEDIKNLLSFENKD